MKVKMEGQAVKNAFTQLRNQIEYTTVHFSNRLQLSEKKLSKTFQNDMEEAAFAELLEKTGLESKFSF